jgi:transposase
MDIPLARDQEVEPGYAAVVNGEGTPPRRQYPLEMKRQVVEETFAPGASVAGVARRHGVNDNLVFEWRKQYRQGKLWNGKPAPAVKPAMSLPGLIRVGVIDHEGGLRPASGVSQASAPAPPRSQEPPPEPSRTVEIELHNGVKVRVDAAIADEPLRRILAAARSLP